MEELSEIKISNNYILDLDNNSNNQKLKRSGSHGLEERCDAISADPCFY